MRAACRRSRYCFWSQRAAVPRLRIPPVHRFRRPPHRRAPAAGVSDTAAAAQANLLAAYAATYADVEAAVRAGNVDSAGLGRHAVDGALDQLRQGVEQYLNLGVVPIGVPELHAHVTSVELDISPAQAVVDSCPSAPRLVNRKTGEPVTRGRREGGRPRRGRVGWRRLAGRRDRGSAGASQSTTDTSTSAAPLWWLAAMCHPRFRWRVRCAHRGLLDSSDGDSAMTVPAAQPATHTLVRRPDRKRCRRGPQLGCPMLKLLHQARVGVPKDALELGQHPPVMLGQSHRISPRSPAGWFVLGPLAIIFGGIGMSRARAGARYRGLALAGVILGVVDIVLWVVLLVAVAHNGGSAFFRVG